MSTLRLLVCALAGLGAGAALAGLKFPGYLHAQVALGPGAQAGPLLIDGSRRQFLALSLTGLKDTQALAVRMKGAEIGSWYPPAVRLPGGGAPDFSGGTFSGFGPGRKLPVYVAFEAAGDAREIEFVDALNGRVLRSVAVVRGNGHAGHQH